MFSRKYFLLGLVVLSSINLKVKAEANAFQAVINGLIENSNLETSSKNQLPFVMIVGLDNQGKLTYSVHNYQQPQVIQQTVSTGDSESRQRAKQVYKDLKAYLK